MWAHNMHWRQWHRQSNNSGEGREMEIDGVRSQQLQKIKVTLATTTWFTSAPVLNINISWSPWIQHLSTAGPVFVGYTQQQKRWNNQSNLREAAMHEAARVRNTITQTQSSFEPLCCTIVAWMVLHAQNHDY